MLSVGTLSFMGFINLFFIPIIGLRIYCKRHVIKWKLTSDMVFFYVLITILNFPFTRVLANGVEKLFIIECHAESSKYTIIALFAVVILPYIIEIMEKTVDIKVEIKYRTEKIICNQEEVTNEEN